MKLLVFGGSGYVGSQICRAAIQMGMSVTGISRRGPSNDVKNTLWGQSVKWYQADALDVDSYWDEVEECDAIVHSIGILFENRMNQMVSGSSSSGESYAVSNRDTAVKILTKLSSMEQQKTFVFISAQSAPPLLSGYLEAKREVEQVMLSINSKNFRPVILRPGFIHHASRPASLGFALLLDAGRSFNQLMKTSTNIGIPGYPSCMSLDTLAKAAVMSCIKSDVHGIIDNEEISQILS